MTVKLEPSLSHCVETVAKREYERVLSLILSGPDLLHRHVRPGIPDEFFRIRAAVGSPVLGATFGRRRRTAFYQCLEDHFDTL